MTLFLFELKKLLFSKKTIAILTVLIAFIILLFVRNFSFQPLIAKEERQAIDAQIRTSQANGRAHILMLEKNPEDEKQKELQSVNLQIRDPLYDLASTYSYENWEENLKVQNKIWRTTLDYKELGGESPFSRGEIIQKITLNEELLKQGIRPEYAAYSIATPNFMKQVVDIWIFGGALILLVLLVGEILSSEYEGHSINLLFTQPFKKMFIVMGKFGSAFILYVFALIITLLTAVIVSFLFGDKGSFSYPILIEKNHSMEFVSIGQYMTKGLVITTSLILLVIALILLYSLYLKRTMSTITALLGTFAIGYVLTAFIHWNSLDWLNPFLNMLPNDLILVQNGRTWYEAIPVTLLLTGIVYGWGIRKVKNSRMEG